MNCLKRRKLFAANDRQPMGTRARQFRFLVLMVFFSHGHTDTGDLMPNILDVY